MTPYYLNLSDMGKTVIPIGFVGENKHRQIIINCTEAFNEYPDAVPSLSVRPPQGDEYPATVTRDGNNVIWEITAPDVVYDGTGRIQLAFTVGEVVARYHDGTFRTHESIGCSGTIPTPVQQWIDQANEVLAEVRGCMTVVVSPDYSGLSFPVSKGEGCIHDNVRYVAKQDIAQSEDWTPEHWEEATVEDSLASLLKYVDDLFATIVPAEGVSF